MKLTQKSRKKIVDSLITNGCGCWEESDRETLNGFDDNKLIALNESREEAHENEAVANAARQGFEAGNTQFKYDVEKGEFVSNKKPMPPQLKPKGKGDDEEEDDEEEMDENAKESKGKDKGKDAAENRAIKLEDLPEEIRAVYNHGKKQLEQERSDLVDRLVANIENKDTRLKQRERLLKRDIEDLREDVALLPAPTDNEHDDYAVPHYVGAGAPVANARGGGQGTRKPEPMGQPEWDFSGQS